MTRFTGIRAAPAIVVAVLGLRLLVAVMTPLAGSTEGRYAHIAQEMACSGDWVTPRIWIDGGQTPFLGKPPLYFWTAALSIEIFGENELAVRLPSLIAAAALLSLLGFVLSRYLDRDTASTAVVMTATSALFVFLAGSVSVDMHLALFVSGAYLALFAFAHESDRRLQRRWSLLVFAMLAGGFLTKGPVAIVAFGLPVTVWTIWRRKLRLAASHAWLPGILLFLAIVLPWFVLAETRNPGFLRYFFVNENLLRYLSLDYGDLYGGGRRYHRGAAVWMFIAAALPWSLAGLGLMAAKYRRRLVGALRDDLQLLLFLGFAINVLFWCFSRQLLITYMLPVIPLFAAWSAPLVHRLGTRHRRVLQIATATVGVWCLLLAAADPRIRASSTRDILRQARAVAAALELAPDLLFAGSTPETAHFYARGNIDTHLPETIEGSLRRALAEGRPRLLIIRRSSFEGLPEELRSPLHPIARDGPWELLLTGREPDRPPEADQSGRRTLVQNRAPAVLEVAASGAAVR